MKTAALIMAAGASKRLGQPKQLVRYHGKTLVAHAVELAHAAGAESVFVVSGARTDQIQSALLESDCDLVYNPNWQEGIGCSIACGTKHILAQDKPESILLMLCDQPFVTATHLASLIGDIASGQHKLAATAYPDGKAGIPACFSETHFVQLAKLTGDVGARRLIAASAPSLRPFENDASGRDIDHPDDLKLLSAETTDEPSRFPSVNGFVR